MAWSPGSNLTYLAPQDNFMDAKSGFEVWIWVLIVSASDHCYF